MKSNGICIGVSVALMIAGIPSGYCAETKSLPIAKVTPFAADQVTRQSKLKQVPGCACSSDKSVEISPSPVKAVAGQPFTISFDATQICQGQTIRDTRGNALTHGKSGALVGTVKWEALSEESLSDVFGQLAHTYSTAGTYSSDINIAVQCYDVGAKCSKSSHYSECSAAGKVTINVQ